MNSPERKIAQSRPKREPLIPFRAVIFDSGGVLVNNSFEHIRDDIAKTLALPVDTVNRGWKAAYPQYGTGEFDEPQFWNRFQEVTGISSLVLPEGPSLLGRAHIENRVPNEEVLAIRSQI